MKRIRNFTLTVGLTSAAYYLFRQLTRRRPAQAPPARGSHIVILGAGFAGLTLARDLAKTRREGVRITLIDRHNYHLFTPLLYQVAAWGLDPYDVAHPVREATGPYGIHFQRALITGIDLDAQQVQLDEGGPVDYDYLAIALGSTTNFFGNQGAQEHALAMKWLEEGVAIRDKLIDCLEQASITPRGPDRDALLTFVVVGGGATGVETAAALVDLLNRVLAVEYPGIDRADVHVQLIEAEKKLLGQMDHKLAQIALKRLHELGVEVWLATRAQQIDDKHLVTDDGRTVPTRTIIWATGVRAPDVIANLDAPHGKGGSLLVDEYLQVQGRPGVYALGDNAHVVDAKTGEAVPLLAQAAVDEAHTVARNILCALAGQPQQPYHYHSLGNALALGRAEGIIETNGIVISGLLGWVAWRLVHLARTTGLRNKLATLLDWTTGYLFEMNTTRLELEPALRNQEETEHVPLSTK